MYVKEVLYFNGRYILSQMVYESVRGWILRGTSPHKILLSARSSPPGSLKERNDLSYLGFVRKGIKPCLCDKGIELL